MGSQLFFYTNNFDYESIRDKKYMGFVVNCKYTSTPYDSSKINVGRIQELVPALNNSFSVVIIIFKLLQMEGYQHRNQ